MAATLLACDWGTTNLRAWTLDEAGEPLSGREFPLGVSRLGPGEAGPRFQDEVRPALEAQHLPAVLCGMVGSNLGWTPAPYVDCPAGLADLSGSLTPAGGTGPAVHIVPGLRCRTLWGGADVMRGEETQVFGWLAANPERQRGRRLVCHPGTHTKWILVENGEIARFQTAMTGELFALLTTQGVLRGHGAADDDAAFDAGVAAAGDGQALAARLYSARARVVGEGRPAKETPSYLSGLLIGADVAATRSLLGAGDLALDLIGEPGLCQRYARAASARGESAMVHDGEVAARAGLFAIFSSAPEAKN